MLYVDAIRILEKIAQARFLHATMPKQEEIEEAIKVVASQVTVQACPGFALHAALWWIALPLLQCASLRIRCDRALRWIS